MVISNVKPFCVTSTAASLRAEIRQSGADERIHRNRRADADLHFDAGYFDQR